MATAGDQYSQVTGNIWNYANRGDEEGVKLALQRGVDVNMQNKVGWTAVHAAARGNQCNMIQFLATKGADLEMEDNEGRLPVHEAARSGHLDTLKLLCKLGCSLSEETYAGQSVLDLAKGEPVKRYVRSVLKGQPCSIDVNASNADGQDKSMHQRSETALLEKPERGGKTKQQPSWKKASSAAVSGRAKKEYLKWKREQKRQQSDDDSEDDYGQVVNAAPPTASVVQEHVGTPEVTDVSEATLNEHDSATRDVQIHEDNGDKTQSSLPSVKTQPMNQEPKKHRRGQRGNHLDRESLEGPIQYVELVCVDQAQAEGNKGGTGTQQACLPRCTHTETGYKQGENLLGMPKRPAWRGIVSTAAQLHALEEQAFESWQQALTDRYPSERVSFYETRLEFWRQLWRVMDLCHVALMIVDARNPLLHFSEALANHILQEHKKPLILVLNKSDLVPSQSVVAWTEWFQSHYRGLHVVASSTAVGPGEAGVAILDAVLGCEVVHNGQRKQVRDVVNMDATQVLAESRQRNTVAKRAAIASVRALPARRQDDTSTAAGDSTGFELDSSALEDDDQVDWELKGNKARKQNAVRRKRAVRMTKAAREVAAPERVLDGVKKVRQKKQGGDAHNKSRHQPVTTVAESTVIEQDTSDIETAASQSQYGEEDDDSVNFNEDLEQMETDMLEDHADQQAAEKQETATPQQHDQQLEQQAARHTNKQNSRPMPVVVCVVGEPNVGKSSTMNALLGAHRVAVSSHPGRTKHYQTHYMTSNLMLCDCPGLVFPRLDVPLEIQVLYGSYPIARCRDPYAVIRYLAARIWPRLHLLLGLHKSDIEEGKKLTSAEDKKCDPDEPWSPLELCEAFAAKKGWRSRKGGRLDVYRAANWILRAALAGKQGVSLAFLPPAEC